jgi:ribokinase
LEGDLTATRQILQRARGFGIPTLFNPAPLGEDFPRELLRHVDILVPNESEFVGLMTTLGQPLTHSRLNSAPGPKLQALCRKAGVATVVVTLGARGCFVSTASRFEFLAAHAGIKAVDTTGAGDAFCGGFAAGFVRSGGDIFAAAKLGNAAGALAVTKCGTAAAMPTARAVAKLLR